MLLQEFIEFGNKLEEIAETKKAPAQGRWRPLSSVSFAPKKDDPLMHCLLTWQWVVVHVLDSELRDAILEAEATLPG
jgi:hypothetical protein